MCSDGWVGGAKANHCALGVSARAQPASATWKRSDRAEKRRYGVAPAGHRSKTPGFFAIGPVCRCFFADPDPSVLLRKKPASGFLSTTAPRPYGLLFVISSSPSLSLSLTLFVISWCNLSSGASGTYDGGTYFVWRPAPEPRQEAANPLSMLVGSSETAGG